MELPYERRPSVSPKPPTLGTIIYPVQDVSRSVLHASTALGEKMSFFGLTDPWIIGGYVMSFVCVAFCVVYGFLSGRSSEEEEDDE